MSFFSASSSSLEETFKRDVQNHQMSYCQTQYFLDLKPLNCFGGGLHMLEILRIARSHHGSCTQT